MTTEGWIFMVGFRVFDVGLLVVWLIWFFRLRDDGDDPPGEDGGGGEGPDPALVATARRRRDQAAAGSLAARARARPRPLLSGCPAAPPRRRVAGPAAASVARETPRRHPSPRTTGADRVPRMGGVIDFGLVDEPVDEITHVVSPHGEIDALTAPRLGRRLLDLAEDGKRLLVVDLSAVTFMDSTGISVLLNALRHQKTRSGNLVLVCPTERILRPFQITGLVGRLRHLQLA